MKKTETQFPWRPPCAPQPASAQLQPAGSQRAQLPQPQAPPAPPGNEAAVFSPASLGDVRSPRPGQPPQTRRADTAETPRSALQALVLPVCFPRLWPQPSLLHKEPRPGAEGQGEGLGGAIVSQGSGVGFLFSGSTSNRCPAQMVPSAPAGITGGCRAWLCGVEEVKGCRS